VISRFRQVSSGQHRGHFGGIPFQYVSRLFVGKRIALRPEYQDSSQLESTIGLAAGYRREGRNKRRGRVPGIPSTEDNILGHAFVLILTGDDDATDAPAVTQDHASPGDKSTVKSGGLTSREIIARIHARMALSRGFGFWSRR